MTIVEYTLYLLAGWKLGELLMVLYDKMFKRMQPLSGASATPSASSGESGANGECTCSPLIELNDTAGPRPRHERGCPKAMRVNRIAAAKS